jgi:hypothetical protein
MGADRSAAYDWLLLEDHPDSVLLRDSVARMVAGEERVKSCRRTGIRKQRGKRLALYGVTCTTPGGAVNVVEVLVKLYGSDRGRRAHDALATMWRAGFHAPSRFRVPRPYGYTPELGALVQARVGGTLWADFLGRDPADARRAACAAADWLRTLQGSGVAAEARPAEEGVAAARYFVRNLGAAYPGSRSRLAALLERVTSGLEAATQRLVPSHGDFHPKNVFLGRKATTVIDFDTFAAREAAWDVGYAIAHLLVMSRLRLGDFRAGIDSAIAFWQRYGNNAGTTWERVATHIGRSLLQSLHFELCVLANGRTDLLTAWPALAERAFEIDEPGQLQGSLRGD